MKSLIAIIACAAVFASCKKGSKEPPPDIAPDCAANMGTATATFTSEHYNTQQSFNLAGCEIRITYKDHHWRPGLVKTSFVIQKDSFSVGIDFPERLDEGDTLWVDTAKLQIRTDIGDEDMYQYASNGLSGSYFVISQVQDSTLSGAFHVPVSRRRTFNNGNNLDTADNGLLEGSFQNIKLLYQHLE